MEKVKNFWSRLKGKLEKFRIFPSGLEKEGGKSRLKKESVIQVASVFIGPLVLLYFYSDGVDSSFLGHSPNSFKGSNLEGQELRTDQSHPLPVPVTKVDSVVNSPKNLTKNSGHFAPIKLNARQVVTRDEKDSGFGFMAGSNFIGELETSIDSRDQGQIAKVSLPFGAKSKDGNAELPKGTILLGAATYSGKGDKVFLSFSQAVFPEGKAVKLVAQALDPRDYSVGLVGEVESQAKSRALSVLGLSVASAMGEVLTEKEALGQGFQVTTKANMKNAILSGASRAAEVEVGRLQEKADQAPDYVKVEAGTAVIVNLTQGLTIL